MYRTNAVYGKSLDNDNVEASVYSSTYLRHVCTDGPSYVQYWPTNRSHNNGAVRAQKAGFMFKVSLQSQRDLSYFQLW